MEKCKPTRKCKYQINESFFENPQNWTQDQAYFMGWLASDGCNRKQGVISIALQEKDKRILEILKDIIKYNGPLLYNRRNGINKFISKNTKKWQNRWGANHRKKKDEL